MSRKVINFRGKELYFDLRENTSDDSVVNESFKNTYNLGEEDFKHSGIFIDIGANIGTVSILASLMNAREIIAFEPEEDNFKCLINNLELNGIKNVQCKKLAVWDIDDLMIGINPNQSFTSVGNQEGNKKIKTITLERILEDFNEVDVIKCDTEGAEYNIFVNPEVNKKARRIVMEFHQTDRGKFENLISKLSLTHKVSFTGSYENICGMLDARRLQK